MEPTECVNFQLQALAKNLLTLANRHRENRNYIVAYELYGRALEIARGFDAPQSSDNGRALVHNIERDQKALFEILRSPEVGSLGVRKGKGRRSSQ